jgi:hypothetical protein
MTKRTLGDGPVEERYREQIRVIAEVIDEFLNGPNKGEARENGFIVMMFPFGGPNKGRCNYISNAERKDVIIMLKEQIARFEGQPEAEGNA